MKFSGLNKLPITVIARLVKIDVRFPAKSANMSEVDARDISPEVENAYPNQTVTPQPNPIIAADVATYRLVSFHNIASDIGATAEPINTPIAK